MQNAKLKIIVSACGGRAIIDNSLILNFDF